MKKILMLLMLCLFAGLVQAQTKKPAAKKAPAKTSAPAKKKPATTTKGTSAKQPAKSAPATAKKPAQKPATTNKPTTAAPKNSDAAKSDAPSKKDQGTTPAKVRGSHQSSYTKAAGVRINPLSHFDLFAGSFKILMPTGSGIEATLGLGFYTFHGDGIYFEDVRTTSLSTSVAYQHHFDIKPVPGLRWYVGGGATGVYTFNKDFGGFVAGVFPTAGIDYKFSSIPLNVSTDYRPTYVFGEKNFHGFIPEIFGLAARYTF